MEGELYADGGHGEWMVGLMAGMGIKLSNEETAAHVQSVAPCHMARPVRSMDSVCADGGNGF
jgi:hypothetical protein